MTTVLGKATSALEHNTWLGKWDRPRQRNKGTEGMLGCERVSPAERPYDPAVDTFFYALVSRIMGCPLFLSPSPPASDNTDDEGTFFTLSGTVSPATARRLQGMSGEEARRALRQLQTDGVPALKMMSGGYAVRRLQTGGQTTTVIPDEMQMNGRCGHEGDGSRCFAMMKYWCG